MNDSTMAEDLYRFLRRQNRWARMGADGIFNCAAANYCIVKPHTPAVLRAAST